MKIIKKGHVPNPTYRVTCPTCGCIFKVRENELQANFLDCVRQVEQTGCCSDTIKNLTTCPCCRHDIIVKDI